MTASPTEALCAAPGDLSGRPRRAPRTRWAEIINGTLHTHPRPAALHAWASSALGIKLGEPFSFGGGGRNGPGGWWIIDEPELHLGEDILVPDLAGWRRERMPDYPDTAFFTLAPDWGLRGALALDPPVRTSRKSAPSTRDEGVAHLWLIDPDGPDAGGVRTPQRRVAPHRDREGRRAGERPPVRRRSPSNLGDLWA